MQEEGEEVHCNLGKTWRDLFKKQGKERKGVCRKNRKREEELEDVKNNTCLVEMERCCRLGRCIRHNFTGIGVSRLGDVDSGKITD